MDDPRIAGFVARLDPINRLGDASPGFVWRLRCSPSRSENCKRLVAPTRRWTCVPPVKNGTTGGTLRFYAEGQGYYNGGVKSFTCLNGQITVKGGGGFVKPDGTRIAVVYEAHFDKTTGQATITVKGKNGFQYTLTGNLDGLTWCGNPTQAPPHVS